MRIVVNLLAETDIRTDFSDAVSIQTITSVPSSVRRWPYPRLVEDYGSFLCDDRLTSIAVLWIIDWVRRTVVHLGKLARRRRIAHLGQLKHYQRTM